MKENKSKRKKKKEKTSHGEQKDLKEDQKRIRR
jgi:hypothetical protein